MTKDNIKLIRDAVIVVALTIALLLGAGYIPFAALVCFLCSGVPLAAFAAKYEVRSTVAVFLVTVLGYLLITGSKADTATVMAVGVLPGVVVGYLLGKKSNFYSVLIAGGTFICLGFILCFVIIEKTYGIKFDQLLQIKLAETGRMMKDTFVQAMEAGADFGDMDVPSEVDAMIEKMGILMLVYLPGIVALFSVIMGYILVRISGFVVRKTKIKEADIVPFSMMKVPRSMCWIAVLVYLFYAFAEPLGSVWVISANVVLVLQAIIAFGGLSCVDYWLAKKIRFTIFRVLIYVAAFFVLSGASALIVNVLVIIAILDSGRDFRKIEPQQQ